MSAQRRCLYVIHITAILCVCQYCIAAQQIEHESEDKESNADEDILTAHIIAHSHCDPGWLDTFESYYRKDVSKILTNVFAALRADANKRFIWSEISFFHFWYDQLSANDKTDFQGLVNSGQIEFVGGGWVQHDEATPHYGAIIDQKSVGHQYLFHHFGVIPKYGWQIDPFGHSSLTPSLFKLLGFDAVVLNRILFSYKAALKAQRNMEFMWRGVDFGGVDDMFTHVLHTHYSAPSGFDWENPAIRIKNHNVNERATVLCDELKKRATAYRTRHLLVPFGDDFKFKKASLQFENMDLLIQHVNANPAEFKVRLRYSTLHEYFTAVSFADKKYAIVSGGDFFPYADNDDSYWSGYYTTRPFLKKISRVLQAQLRAAELVASVARASIHTLTNIDEDMNKLLMARQDAALFLHHDAITGTSRAHVVKDYMTRLQSASKNARDITLRLLQPLLFNPLHSGNNMSLTITSNTLSLHDKNSINVQPVFVLNTLSWMRRELVCFSVTTAFLAVENASGIAVRAQVYATWSIINNDVNGKPSGYRLCFVAKLPSTSITIYFLHTAASSELLNGMIMAEISHVNVLQKNATPHKFTPSDSIHFSVSPLVAESDLTLTNAHLHVALAHETGLLKSITHRQNNMQLNVQQKFLEYTTKRGGAYLFRPLRAATLMNENVSPVIRIVKGSVVDSVDVTVGDLRCIIELVHIDDDDDDDDDEDIEHTIARRIHINFSAIVEINHEIVARFVSDIDSGDKFYSHNAMEFVERRRHYDTTLLRADTNTNTIARNFYPSVSGAKITGMSGKTLRVATSHTSSVSSMASGELEFMLHRALGQDDGRGLAEAIVDRTRSEMKMYLFFDTQIHNPAPSATRRALIELDNPPVPLFGVTTNIKDATLQGYNVADWRNCLREFPHLQLLAPVFPLNMHLLSYFARDINTDDVVMRVQNLADREEQRWPLDFNMKNIFPQSSFVDVVDMRETSLNSVYDFETKSGGGEAFDIPYQYLPRSLHFESSGTTISLLNGVEELSGGNLKQDNQNAEEEGVFISDEALKRKRLREQQQQQRMEQQQNARNTTSGRQLLMMPADSSSFIIAASARQIRTFVFHVQNVMKPSLVMRNENKISSPVKNNLLDEQMLPSVYTFVSVFLLSVLITIAIVFVLRIQREREAFSTRLPTYARVQQRSRSD